MIIGKSSCRNPFCIFRKSCISSAFGNVRSLGSLRLVLYNFPKDRFKSEFHSRTFSLNHDISITSLRSLFSNYNPCHACWIITLHYTNALLLSSPVKSWIPAIIGFVMAGWRSRLTIRPYISSQNCSSCFISIM